MIRRGLGALALVSVTTALPAQGAADFTLIAGPQFVSYRFGSGPFVRTVSEIAIPLAAIVPFGDRFTLDLSSALADVRVSAGGVTTSSLRGLTDTQVRGNLALGDRTTMLTFGVNLPTGQYAVGPAELEAAGQMGSDFLLYPVSSMGNGLAVTGGFALARPLGDWNLGLGASLRHSARFDAYRLESRVLHFTPGDEYRVRIGVDRPVGAGSFSAGLAYSRFGGDASDSTTLPTGDRALVQGSIFLPGSSGDLSISAWDLYRGGGRLIGSDAPPENVADVSVAFGLHVRDAYVQPSAEVRLWQVDGVNAGVLTTLGVRLRLATGSLTFNPGISYAIGRLNATGNDPASAVTGFKATLLVRLR